MINVSLANDMILNHTEHDLKAMINTIISMNAIDDERTRKNVIQTLSISLALELVDSDSKGALEIANYAPESFKQDLLLHLGQVSSDSDWSKLIKKKYEDCLGSDDPFIRGVAELFTGDFAGAIRDLRNSKSNISDSYNGIGIALYNIGEYREALLAFEKSVKAKMDLHCPALLNAANVCKKLKKYKQQRSLLSFYVSGDKYQSAKSLLLSKNIAESLREYNAIYEECVDTGKPFPSETFLAEFCYLLNATQQYGKTAYILSTPITDMEKEIVAKAMFGLKRYDKCYELVKGTPNQGIMEFLSGHVSKSISTLTKYNTPGAIRNLSIILISEETKRREGCELWLTYNRFPLGHQASFYRSIAEELESPDPLTLSALRTYAAIVSENTV